MQNWIATGEIPSMPDVRLKKSELLILFKSDTRYRAIHSLLRWRNPRDLWTNEIISSDDIEDHHIFPAVISKRDNDKGLKRNIDSIVNRLLVSRATNRALGDRYPSDYLVGLVNDAVSNGTIESKTELFQKSCLPITATDLSVTAKENFQAFISQRADLILAAIKTVVGDLLNSSENTGDSDDADEED
jgi:hypothetical protein